MKYFKNAADALVYYADCQAATLDYFVDLKGAPQYETARHVLMCCEILRLAAELGNDDPQYQKNLQSAKSRFHSAIQRLLKKMPDVKKKFSKLMTIPDSVWETVV